MKILLLLSRFDQTGMTTNTLDLYNGLRRFNPETYLLVGAKENIRDTSPEIYKMYDNVKDDDNINYFYIPKAYNSKIELLKSVYSACRMIRKIKPDIVHCESPYYTFIPWLLRVPFLTTMHVTDIYPTMSYKRGRGVIAISDATRKWAIDVCKHKLEDVHMVLHGVSAAFADGADDVKHISEVRADFGLPQDKVLIGLVGSIEYRKGHDLLLQAVASLSKEAREKVHVVFVGSDKSKGQVQKAWLIKQILLKNLGDCVTHIPYTTRVKEVYQALDIKVLPSRQEGFPMVVIEAMMANCCVIRSNTEGAYEQIEQGKSGYVFENENVEQLANYLEEVVMNDEKRKQMAKAGQERALSLFTNDVMARNTYNVYEKLLRK